ncbi:MAG: hypothetical protein Q9162_002383 [Coniocarpon cinnabarinum]
MANDPQSLREFGNTLRFGRPSDESDTHVDDNLESLINLQHESIFGHRSSPRSTDPYSTQQPGSRSISQDQLAAEVKEIYSGLVMVEQKCVSVVNEQSLVDGLQCPHTSKVHAHGSTVAHTPSVDNQAERVRVEHFPALVALHRTLLHEHHDFLSASQHPSANTSIKELAAKYPIPAQMWKHGIHNCLELLRHRLPSSPEYMLAFLYLAYQMMALLFETVPTFENTWFECLGDLARYWTAIEDEDIRDREDWTKVARYWHMRAADKKCALGRLHNHLGVLTRKHYPRGFILTYDEEPSDDEYNRQSRATDMSEPTQHVAHSQWIVTFIVSIVRQFHWVGALHNCLLLSETIRKSFAQLFSAVIHAANLEMRCLLNPKMEMGYLSNVQHSQSLEPSALHSQAACEQLLARVKRGQRRKVVQSTGVPLFWRSSGRGTKLLFGLCLLLAIATPTQATPAQISNHTPIQTPAGQQTRVQNQLISNSVVAASSIAAGILFTSISRFLRLVFPNPYMTLGLPLGVLSFSWLIVEVVQDSAISIKHTMKQAPQMTLLAVLALNAIGFGTMHFLRLSKAHQRQMSNRSNIGSTQLGVVQPQHQYVLRCLVSQLIGTGLLVASERESMTAHVALTAEPVLLSASIILNAAFDGREFPMDIELG